MTTVCRTCLKTLDKFNYHILDARFQPKNLPSLLDQCKICVPEIDFEAIEGSVICNSCYRKMVTFFNFKLTCIESDKKLQEMIKNEEEELLAKSEDVYLNDIVNSDVAFSQIEVVASNETVIADSVEISAIEESNSMEILDPALDFTEENAIEVSVIEENNTTDVPVIEESNTVEAPVIEKNNTIQAPVIEEEKPLLECSECNYSTCYLRNFQKHLFTHKSNLTSKINVRGKFPYPIFIQKLSGNESMCKICKRTFSDRRMLVTHIRFHLEKGLFKCAVCNLRYSSKHNLNTHMRIHSNVKSFTCKYCSFKTMYNSALQAHTRRHTGEKPYKCDMCDRSFRLLPSLRSHRSEHTGEKPFKCHMCDKGFQYLCGLINHRKEHSGIKPHACNVCGKSFYQRYILVRHLRTHLPQSIKAPSTPKKPQVELHTCDECGYQTNNKTYLKRHLKVHEGDNLQKCYFCNAKFRAWISVVNHMKSHPEYALKIIE